MFREWGFLLGEIWVLLLLAALIGLLAGWIIWGRRSSDKSHSASADLASCRSELVKCREAGATKDQEIARLKADIDAAKEAAASKPAPKKKAAPAKKSAPAKATKAAPAKKSTPAKKSGPTKPKTLKAARGGKADDLKLIKGIGPQMEKLCNKLGFYHFDQVAKWTASEVKWVDENLEGFKGRVTRDSWVRQAKVLARGGETEFSKRKKKK